MLKGLPAIVFQGASVFVLLAWRQRWRILFGWQHLLGALVFLLPVGLYYYAYAQRADMEPLFRQLWWESAQRSGLKHGALDTVKQLFTFPGIMWYHYLPWSALLLLLFRRGTVALVRQSPYITACALLFGINVIPYWISPDVYPKYILMLVPLAYTVGFYNYQQLKDTRPAVVFRGFLRALVTLMAVLSVYLFFAPETADVALRYPKAAFVSLGLAAVSYFIWTSKKSTIGYAIVALLIFRLAFDWFIYPPRAAKRLVFQAQAERVVELTQGAPLYYLDQQFVQHGHSYYLTRGRQALLENETDAAKPNTYYLTTPAVIDERGLEVEEFYRFAKTENSDTLVLMQLR